MVGSVADRLHSQMAGMVALEQTLARRAADLAADVDHEAVATLLDGLAGSSRARREALSDRLASVAPHAEIPPTPAHASLLEGLYGIEEHPASGALVALHALLTQGVLGYALTVELSFRSADSVEHRGPDNTGDLAWGHLKECTTQVRDVLRLMPYVVVDELDGAGQECECRCPACGLGICGCGLAFRRRLDLAAAETGPIEDWPGLTLVRPRGDSPIAAAGLVKGDVLEQMDGVVIDSIPTLQASIERHAVGDTIELRVQRAGRHGAETVTVTRR